MKLNKLNLQGKGELLNEFELKNIKGGYYFTDSCQGWTSAPVGGTCSGSCKNHTSDKCQVIEAPGGTHWCACQ